MYRNSTQYEDFFFFLLCLRKNKKQQKCSLIACYPLLLHTFVTDKYGNSTQIKLISQPYHPSAHKTPQVKLFIFSFTITKCCLLTSTPAQKNICDRTYRNSTQYKDSSFFFSAIRKNVTFLSTDLCICTRNYLCQNVQE